MRLGDRNHPLHARRRAPSYRVVHVSQAKDGNVFLVDLDDDPLRPSVTNAAEEVVERILAEYGPERRIFYQDTTGRWDELVHDGKRFTGFRAGSGGFTPPAV